MTAFRDGFVPMIAVLIFATAMMAVLLGPVAVGAGFGMLVGGEVGGVIGGVIGMILGIASFSGVMEWALTR